MSSGTQLPGAAVRVLLIEDNPGDAGLVRAMLAESPGLEFRIEWVQALLPAMVRLGRGEIDMILLDLSLPDSQGLGSLTAVRNAAPSVPVVVLTGLSDEDVAHEAVRCGAQDYLVKGELSGGALARTLSYAMLRQRNQARALKPGAELGRAVGFLGARGGVGTTTIACHFALELKERTASRVLLADLDVAGGSAGFLMKAASEHTIQEAASNLARLDENYWNKIVVSVPDGPDVLLSQGSFALEEQANSERVRNVFDFSRSIYPWIIIDLGRMNPLAVSLVPGLSDVFLIATLEVAVLYEVKRVVSRLTDIGGNRDRLHLIVNQTPKHPEISPGEAGKMVSLSVDAILPECGSDLSEAYTDGKLLNAKSDLRRQLGRLAEKVAGLEAKKSK
ncbi:MAG TPA: response regulator [Bryobacteraceae bacterium]|nr:response regulator [Bryobacteraceae bacterium]